MELQLEKNPSGHRIGSFTDDTLVIGGLRYTASLIVTLDQVVRDWPPQHPDQLSIDDFAMILTFKPELILIGTGNTLRFPNSGILKDVIRAGVGIDFMDTRAVCRTYNVLAAEGRHVVAGIIIEQLVAAN